MSIHQRKEHVSHMYHMHWNRHQILLVPLRTHKIKVILDQFTCHITDNLSIYFIDNRKKVRYQNLIRALRWMGWLAHMQKM